MKGIYVHYIDNDYKQDNQVALFVDHEFYITLLEKIKIVKSNSIRHYDGIPIYIVKDVVQAAGYFKATGNIKEAINGANQCK